MKRLLPLIVLLSLGLLIGCGGDDEEPPTGGGTTIPSLQVVAATSAPSLTDPDDAGTWGGITPETLSVGAGSDYLPKGSVGKVSSIPTNILVQATTFGGNLYLRLQWVDPTLSAYPDYYAVTKVSPPVEFSHDQIAEEDQIYVMFSDGAGGYDGWNWKVLSTGGAGMGAGYTMTDATTVPVLDSAGSASISTVVTNPATFNQPTYFPADTSEFTGYKLLFDANILHRTDTVRLQIDPILNDTVPITPPLTGGWTVGQKIPGWLVQPGVADRPEAERGSRWDIKTVDKYDSLTNMYTVVLCRKLNTTYADDVDLSVLDSVKVKIAVLDNQDDFIAGGTARGFSEFLWLVF